jgi:isopentenyl-diphosphate Delta-isomerase
MTTEKEVVLVNERDESLGTMEKMEAHRKGILHRAFSVFIFNSKGEMLLQQRASGKYHSGGLWTNACCSHPATGENVADAAARRLMEEMGFSVSLKKIFDFIYRSEMANGLTEHEFDHVFAGYYDGVITPDKNEVKDYCYKSLESIKQNLQTHPHQFTAWFHIAFPRVEKWKRDLQEAV